MIKIEQEEVKTHKNTDSKQTKTNEIKKTPKNVIKLEQVKIEEYYDTKDCTKSLLDDLND